MSDKVRSARNRELVARFGRYMTGSVLDVGCWERDLRLHLPEGVRYWGVDIGGDPDERMDLDMGVLLMHDGEFDCVVISDVLEHLSKPHATFDECLRVARRYLVVTLPNCAAYVKRAVLSGGDMPSLYGLPTLEPHYRNLWLMNYDDARWFVQGRAWHNGARVVEAHTVGDWNRWWKRLLMPRELRRRNLWATGYWAVVEKP